MRSAREQIELMRVAHRDVEASQPAAQPQQVSIGATPYIPTEQTHPEGVDAPGESTDVHQAAKKKSSKKR